MTHAGSRSDGGQNPYIIRHDTEHEDVAGRYLGDVNDRLDDVHLRRKGATPIAMTPEREQFKTKVENPLMLLKSQNLLLFIQTHQILSL